MINKESLAAINQQRSLDRVKQLKAVKQIAAKESLIKVGKRDQTSGKYQVTNATGIISVNGVKNFNTDPDNAATIQSNQSGVNLVLDGKIATSFQKGKKRGSKTANIGSIRERIRSDGLGDRGQNNGYINGQLWNFPEPENDPTKGLLFWLDTNWLWTGIRLPENAFIFFKKALKYFLKSGKKIYTLPFNDTRIANLTNIEFFDENPNSEEEGLFQVALNYPPLVKALELLNYKIIEAPLTELEKIDSLYFMPLLKQDAVITESEYKILRRLSKKYGVMICGEWDTWTDHDRRILEGMNIRKEIEITEINESSIRKFDDNYVIKNPKFGNVEFSGDATNRFTNLTTREIVVNVVNDDKTVITQAFALLQSKG